MIAPSDTSKGALTMGLPLWTTESSSSALCYGEGEPVFYDALDGCRVFIEQLSCAPATPSLLGQRLSTVGASLEETCRLARSFGYPGWLHDGRDADASLFADILARLMCTMHGLSAGEFCFLSR